MYGRSLAVAFLLLISLQLPFDAFADNSLFSSEGYRIARYRAALPKTPPAGQRLNTQELVDLISQVRPLLIDVQAITLRPESEKFGISWLPSRERWHIPHSTWLPNVGYGSLEPRMLSYLKTNLQRLTRGDQELPLVFYCVVDCWMSWNAVKRADDLGYRNLYWYPEGSDGWGEAGLELVPARPVPLQKMTDADD